MTDRRATAYLLIFAGLVKASGGEPERAMALHEEGLALCREIKDLQGMSMCLINWGLMEMARANHARATELLRENLRLGHASDFKNGIQWSFVGLAGVALGQGQPARAARLWGAAEALRESFGMHFTPLARSHIGYEDLLNQAHARLGDAAFERAWAEGKVMPQDRAVGYALADDESAPEDVRSGPPPAPLTRREEEVAALVARGLTNRRIAEELSVSRRTVDTHVGRILKKLGLRSRDEISARGIQRRDGQAAVVE